MMNRDNYDDQDQDQEEQIVPQPSGRTSEKNVGKPVQKPVERSSDNTFLTSGKVDEGNPPYTLHDLLFPAGKVAKLVINI